MDELLIKRETRHHSGAVRAYKQPSSEQGMMVSSILQPPPAKKKPHLQKPALKENIPPSVLDDQPSQGALVPSIPPVHTSTYHEVHAQALMPLPLPQSSTIGAATTAA